MPNHWHPEGCGVSVATQDGILDLSDVSWQEVQPCGCVSGVTMAATGSSERDLIVTAEQAGRQFAQSAREYARDVKRGTSWRPREHKAAVREMRGGKDNECPHDPKWGYEKRPEVEGMTWCAVYALGSTSPLLHLVSDEGLENAKEHRYGTRTKPLCGGREQFHWSDEWHATSGKVECSRCESKARQAVSA